jgi:hypothetical protein
VYSPPLRLAVVFFIFLCQIPAAASFFSARSISRRHGLCRASGMTMKQDAAIIAHGD